MNDRNRDIGISVVIPVYNTEPYLRRCLESVLENVEESDEIIIIDDGSTDNSAAICMEIEEQNPSVTYIRQDNVGLGCTRNRGVQIASNEYIIFIDSDDYWKSGLLEKVRKRLINKKIDILYFDAECIYENNSAELKKEFCEEQYCRVGKISNELMTGAAFWAESYPEYFIVSACMAVFRRTFLLEHEIRFQEGIYFEDLIFSLQAVLEADQVQYLPEQLYVRRYRTSSIMVSETTLKKLENYVCMLERICEYAIQFREKCADDVLWKLYDFPYRTLSHFEYMEKKYQGGSAELSALEIRAYRAVFSLTVNDNAVDCVSGGKFLYALLEIEKRDYADVLIHELFSPKYGDGLTVQKVWKIYQMNYRKAVHTEIQKLPIFDRAARVGIYGGGKAAEGLIKECSRIGKITDHLCIIESSAEEGKKFLEKYPIISITDAGDRIDAVILSSYRYQREMLKMTKQYLTDSTKVILLHDSKIGPIWWTFLS